MAGDSGVSDYRLGKGMRAAYGLQECTGADFDRLCVLFGLNNAQAAGLAALAGKNGRKTAKRMRSAGYVPVSVFVHFLSGLSIADHTMGSYAFETIYATRNRIADKLGCQADDLPDGWWRMIEVTEPGVFQVVGRAA